MPVFLSRNAVRIFIRCSPHRVDDVILPQVVGALGQHHRHVVPPLHGLGLRHRRVVLPLHGIGLLPHDYSSLFVGVLAIFIVIPLVIESLLVA